MSFRPYALFWAKRTESVRLTTYARVTGGRSDSNNTQRRMHVRVASAIFNWQCDALIYSWYIVTTLPEDIAMVCWRTNERILSGSITLARRRREAIVMKYFFSVSWNCPRLTQTLHHPYLYRCPSVILYEGVMHACSIFQISSHKFMADCMLSTPFSKHSGLDWMQINGNSLSCSSLYSYTTMRYWTGFWTPDF